MPRTARSRPAWVAPVTIGWVSFLAAGVAETLFFATFEPERLIDAATFPHELSRLGVYTLGFLLFWLFAAATATAAVWLLHAEPLRSDAADHADAPDA